MDEKLATEKGVFDVHYNDWVKKYPFKYVLIKDKEIIGFYDSLEKGFKVGIDKYGLDNFYLKQIVSSKVNNVSFMGQVAY